MPAIPTEHTADNSYASFSPSKMGSSEMEITEQEILAQSRGIAGMGEVA
jgi:hypothetical protein